MRRSFLAIVFSLVLPLLVFSSPPHIEKAKTFIGVTETAPNDGLEVAVFLKSVGVFTPAPWCAGFVGYCLTEVGATSPKPSPTALGYRNKTSIPIQDIVSGKIRCPEGAVFIMRAGDSWKGHTGFIDSVYWRDKQLRFLTIEGNTGPQPGTADKERDGDGVYRRERTYQPWNYLRLTHVTPVFYRSAG